MKIPVIRLALAGFVLASVFGAPVAYAATPSSGTLSQSNPTVTWAGPATPTPTGSATCNGPNDSSCDNFKLTIIPPAPTFGPYIVVIQTVSFAAGDWDLQVYDPNGKLVGSSGNGPGVTSPEVESVTLFNPPAGTYTVAAAPFSPVPNPSGSYQGSASLQHLTATTVSGNGTEPLSYAMYPNPNGVSAGEPSCGADWKTKKLMYQAGLTTLRVSFNDCTSPATAKWEDVSFTSTSIISFDAILFTDSRTGLSIVSQLISPAAANPTLGLTAGCSLSAVTSDDGTTWIPSEGCGPPSGADHESVGGGRYHDLPAGPFTNPVYPNAVYYCAQSGVDAYCSRSDDGGVTYGPGVIIYTSECGGLHGHVKVAPNDGTAYVPNRSCGTTQGVVVSEDNGITWHVRPVTGSFAGDNDPSVAAAADGTVYFGYQDSDGHPKVAVSHDKGLTWANIQDVGGPLGIQNTAFPVMVAGDATRAAFGFLGTPTGGGSQAADFTGVWHLYVSHTYDGGKTWTTVDATPNDPVQRGCIWLQGGTNPCRNLLDFMDASVDQDGRVIVAVPDGCIGDCVAKGPNSYSALSTIARQVNGRRLFASSDVQGVPGAPLVTASVDCTNSNQVVLSWPTPEAPVTAPVQRFTIYKSTDGGKSFVFLATVPASTTNPAASYEYIDTITAGQAVLYKVTAHNANGDSATCNPVAPTTFCPPPQSPCVFPGVTILTAPSGGFTIGTVENDPSWDVTSLSIAEPASLADPINPNNSKIMFILKVTSLQNPAKDTTWPIVFKGANGQNYWVRMSDVVTTSNPTGAIQFAYGTGSSGTASPSNPGTPADPASGFTADGYIRIVVPRSAIGGPTPGQQLSNFLVRIYVEDGAGGGLTPKNMPSSTTPGGNPYTIFGAENCAKACTAPTANPDSATTTENQPVVINVVANDTDGGSPPITVTGVTQPTNGTATNNGNGTVTYHPNQNFTGTDSFKYTIQNGCGAKATGNVTVTVNAPPPPPQCYEDDDPHISYDNGWHTINDSNASAGHYHLKTGNADPHGMSFSYQLQSAQGTLQYFYATSSKGGTADVYLDGAFAATISYQGGSGSMHNPTFGVSASFNIAGQGSHTFELRNINGPAYVDKICVTNSSPSSQPSAGPGTTSTSTNALAIGQSLLQNLVVPSNALAYSVVAESSANVPYKLIVIDPSGKVLGTVNSSANGIATVQGLVSVPGLYVIQMVNVGVGPVNIWTAATPEVTR